MKSILHKGAIYVEATRVQGNGFAVDCKDGNCKYLILKGDGMGTPIKTFKDKSKFLKELIRSTEQKVNEYEADAKEYDAQNQDKRSK